MKVKNERRYTLRKKLGPVGDSVGQVLHEDHAASLKGTLQLSFDPGRGVLGCKASQKGIDPTACESIHYILGACNGPLGYGTPYFGTLYMFLQFRVYFTVSVFHANYFQNSSLSLIIQSG